MGELIRNLCFYLVAIPMMVLISPMVLLMALMDRPKNWKQYKLYVTRMMDWRLEK